MDLAGKAMNLSFLFGFHGNLHCPNRNYVI